MSGSVRACSIEGCHGSHWARGFCHKHYSSHRRRLISDGSWEAHEPKPHGTAAAYYRHLRRGDGVACYPCRRAARDYARRQRNMSTRGDIARMSETIVDILAAEDRWLSRGALFGLVSDIHPEWSPKSMNVLLGRLVKSGHLRTREGDDGLLFRSDLDALDALLARRSA